MRRSVPYALVLLLTVGTGSVLRLALAQEAAPVTPARHVESAASRPERDPAKLTPAQQAFYRGAHRGMDWLRRTNRQDGKFVYGFLPALRVPMEGDSYLAQAGAAFALARAGRYFQDETSLAISRQALLTLLLETTLESQKPPVRVTAAPPHLLNRLASHGALLLAIHELPEPGQDLLDQAEQLARYIPKQQQSDGSLRISEAGDEDSASERSIECAGLALHGLMRSHRLQPAPWKPELVRKACAYYQGCWQHRKSVPLAVSHTPAYAEAYLLTKDRTYADLVFSMNDWLCSLQYQDLERSRAHWVGGFPPWINGQAVTVAPDIHSAAIAESLAEACRVARAAGDVTRLRRYSQTLERCLQFVLTLQYNETRTQHYVENFRPALLGAFHASHQDGNLRIDYTQHALSALVQYLDQAAE